MHYKDTASYIFPGTSMEPSFYKKTVVKRHIQLVKFTVGSIPQSAFQVGCSNGYTLSEFRNAGASTVAGIDPSIAASKISRKLYGIKNIVSSFEDYSPTRKYELVILTHVLEHLFNPLKAMVKCNNMQNEGDWIYIEVPLLERPGRFPNGYFTFEHLNYFSELTLLNLLSLTGYIPYLICKRFYFVNSPVISIVAKKKIMDGKKEEISSDYHRADTLLHGYFAKEKSRWNGIEQRLKEKVTEGTEVYIWGAGFHTSNLFSFTDLKDYLSVRGLIDSSPTKKGKKMGDLICYSPFDINLEKGDIIIISSLGSEQEIYNDLAPYRKRGITVIRIYDEPSE